MKLKTIFLGILTTSVGFSAFAQTSEVTTARTEYGKYISLRQSPQLAAPSIKTAKESIDKAVVHKKTSTDPAAWTYKALIYSELALADSANTANPNPLITEAVDAIKKATELDANGENKKNIATANDMLYAIQVRKALKLYNAKTYGDAYNEFVKGLDFIPGDTIVNYYAGVTAQNLKNYPAAIGHYNELLKTNFSYMTDVYTNLAESYAASRDTAAAIKTLAEGFAKFPASSQLASRQIEFGINSGKYKETIPTIEAQIQANPTNKFYPFYLGIAYANLNDVPKAEAAYKKAIENDPNFLEAYINMGSLIMNNGIDSYNAANKKYANRSLKPAELAEYNAIKKKATAEFDRALPYVSKATELDPKSKQAWNSLRAYYQSKSNTTKVKEIDEKLKTL